MAVIELDQLSKTFGGSNALKALTLKTEDSEFVVLVGPSTCGLVQQPGMLHAFHAAGGRSVLAA